MNTNPLTIGSTIAAAIFAVLYFGYSQIFATVVDLKQQVAVLRVDLAQLSKSSKMAAPQVSHSRGQLAGWEARVFEPPKDPNKLVELRRKQFAGAFLHTGNWINLAEHNSHSGIFVQGAGALNLRGDFIPKKRGNFIFRLDIKYEGNAQITDRPTVFACYATMGNKTQREILGGKFLISKNKFKDGMIAPMPIAMEKNERFSLDALITCNLPQGVQGKDISFRLCVRKSDEPGFRPARVYVEHTSILNRPS